MRPAAGIRGSLCGCESFSQAPVARTRQKPHPAASSVGMNATFRSLFAARRRPNHRAQFCALCARFCAPTGDRSLVLDNYRSHLIQAQLALLPQGFRCPGALLTDLYRYWLFGRLTQMAFRRSRVRSASAPPIKSSTIRLLNIVGRAVVARWSDVEIFAGRTATATIATPIRNAVQF